MTTCGAVEGSGRLAIPANRAVDRRACRRGKLIVVADGNPYVSGSSRAWSYLVTYGLGDALERAAARAVPDARRSRRSRADLPPRLLRSVGTACRARRAVRRVVTLTAAALAASAALAFCARSPRAVTTAPAPTTTTTTTYASATTVRASRMPSTETLRRLARHRTAALDAAVADSAFPGRRRRRHARRRARRSMASAASTGRRRAAPRRAHAVGLGVADEGHGDDGAIMQLVEQRRSPRRAGAALHPGVDRPDKAAVPFAIWSRTRPGCRAFKTFDRDHARPTARASSCSRAARHVARRAHAVQRHRRVLLGLSSSA